MGSKVERQCYTYSALRAKTDAQPAQPAGPGACIRAVPRLTHKLALAQIRRLPVVDEEGRLVGMFTRSDVIRAALRLRRSAQPKGFMM